MYTENNNHYLCKYRNIASLCEAISNERHRCANQMKNIYGAVPRGYRYMDVA